MLLPSLPLIGFPGFGASARLLFAQTQVYAIVARTIRHSRPDHARHCQGIKTRQTRADTVELVVQPGDNELVDQVHKIARKKGCSSAQLALAWVRSVSKRPNMPVIIPIPGATKSSRVQENSKAIELGDAEVKELDQLLAEFTIAGTRYPQGVPTET